jgi:hypothetical protein
MLPRHISPTILCRGKLFTEQLPRNEKSDTIYRACAYQREEGFTCKDTEGCEVGVFIKYAIQMVSGSLLITS